jgi:hypothetical protein
VKTIQSLSPEMIKKVNAFLSVLDEENIFYSIVETRRSRETQEAYYSQGRDSLEVVNAKRAKLNLYKLSELENKNKITWTLDSKHIEGNAIDIAPVINGKIPWNITCKEIAEKWLQLGKIGESVGLIWGGRWKPISEFGIGKDAPHFEI